MEASFGWTTCGLCDEPLGEERDQFRSSAGFLPRGDPLYPLSGVPLHWACYAGWEQRPRFARAYLSYCVTRERALPCTHRVHLHPDTVFLSVSHAPHDPVARGACEVVVAPTGWCTKVPLREWSRWLSEAVDLQAHPLHRTTLEFAKARLRKVVPTATDVVERHDVRGKEVLIERYQDWRRALEDEDLRRRARQRRRAERGKAGCNREATELALRASTRGMTCPHCGSSGTHFRQRAQKRGWLVVFCLKCEGELEPEGLVYDARHVSR